MSSVGPWFDQATARLKFETLHSPSSERRVGLHLRPKPLNEGGDLVIRADIGPIQASSRGRSHARLGCFDGTMSGIST